MEWLYVACVVVSGVALVVITLMIPIGVFMRYVMNNPQSWPEPASVVLMVMLSFLGGAAVYRANVHVAVEALLNAVSPAKRRMMLWVVDACMAATALFMIGLRHPALPDHAVPEHGRISMVIGGVRLHADSDQRIVHAAVSDRTRLARQSA